MIQRKVLAKELFKNVLVCLHLVIAFGLAKNDLKCFVSFHFCSVIIVWLWLCTKKKQKTVRYEFGRLPLVAGLLRHRCSPSTAVIFRSLCVSPLLITCTWASAVPTGSPPVYQNSDSSTWLTFLGNGRIAGSQIWQSGWLVNQNWVGVASAPDFSVCYLLAYIATQVVYAEYSPSGASAHYKFHSE